MMNYLCPKLERAALEGEPPTTLAKLLADIADTPKNAVAWDLPPTLRGISIKAHLAATDYREWQFIGAGNFPVVDFASNGMAEQTETFVRGKPIDSDWAASSTSRFLPG